MDHGYFRNGAMTRSGCLDMKLLRHVKLVKTTSRRTEKDLLMRAILLIALVSATASAAPRETKFKEITLDVVSGDKLAISCPRAAVKLIASTSPTTTLRVKKTLADSAAEGGSRFEGMTFSVKKENGIVRIECSGADSKEELAKAVKAGAGDFHFDVEGASLPVEVGVRGGNVNVQGWKHAVTATIVEGRVQSSATENALRVQLQRGEVKIEGHKGLVVIDSQSAKIAASNVEGDMNVVNFAGESALSSVRGNVDAKLDSGTFTIAKSSGSLDFIVGRGTLNANGFSGPFRGENVSGSVLAELLGDVDVSIEADRGSVNIKAPPGSGATVRLQTSDGSLQHPPSVKPAGGTAKAAVGTLNGSGSKGTINVRSKSGSIRLRE